MTFLEDESKRLETQLHVVEEARDVAVARLGEKTLETHEDAFVEEKLRSSEPGARRASLPSQRRSSASELKKPRQRSASVSMAMVKAAEEGAAEHGRNDEAYSAAAKDRVKEFLTETEHVRLLGRNADRAADELAKLDEAFSQRLTNVIAVVEAIDEIDDDEDGGVDLEDMGYEEIRRLKRSNLEAEVLCLREVAAARSESVAHGNARRVDFRELDSLVGGIEAASALERQERLKLQERLAAASTAAAVDAKRVCELERELARARGQSAPEPDDVSAVPSRAPSPVTAPRVLEAPPTPVNARRS